MTQKPTIGRIVHYVLADGRHRAATVVNAWPDSAQSNTCNLTVHLDGMNDVLQPHGANAFQGYALKPGLRPEGAVAQYLGDLSLAVGSAKQDENTKAPGTWHYPERE